MRCSMLNLQSEGHGLMNMGPRLSLSRHTQDRCRSISWLKYDPNVNRTAKSYFTTIVNKKQKQSETKLDGSPTVRALRSNGGQSQWRLTALTNEAMGSKVVWVVNDGEWRNERERWPGTRIPSTHRSTHVISRLDMYRTKVLMYHTTVLMARLTKVRR
jgi:hypothetical protein